MAATYITCRVLNRRGVQCTAEAVDPNAELKICIRHLGEAVRLLKDARLSAANARQSPES
ncbi:hypothetical protein HRW07_10090 [Streptomyces lunaelactis]|uniref:hypothetical protein n=1 Tax=Streptomyces lunaelactis TaxID=1535768 RepID=UPI0015853862|nr:hypothetical protein [Streptomyces lunaelactis]NUL03578.1 hypothetical protein [Streptomyces lunaelactis]